MTLLQTSCTPSAASAVYCASITLQIDSSFWLSRILPAAGVLRFLMAAIRIAIVGVGYGGSALVQGIAYHRRFLSVAGLMHRHRPGRRGVSRAELAPSIPIRRTAFVVDATIGDGSNWGRR